MKKPILALFLCAFLSGCYVQSLNRFYTEDLQVDLPQIVGEWLSTVQMGEDVTRENVSPWRFTAKTIETYDENNKFSELETAYFKIGDSLFMDFTAGNPLKDSAEFCNIYWGAGITLTHSLCKVSLDGNRLVLIPLNFDWFEERIKEKKLQLSFVKADKESNYIFTVPASRWVFFLKKYARDKEVFDEKYKFVFQKKDG